MTQRTRPYSRALYYPVMLLALVALLVGSVGTAQAATSLKGSFGGEAFGTYANATAGKAATTLGRSAYIACGCLGTGGVTRSNTVNTVDYLK